MAVDAMTEEEEMAADAVMIADLQIIAACGSSYYSSAVADSEMAAADVVAAAVATTAVSSHLSKCSVDFL